MYYVISDLCFNSTTAAQERGFESEARMNAFLIDKWNSVVGKDDSIFVYGEFFAKGTRTSVIKNIISHLNGKIYMAYSGVNTYIKWNVWKILGVHATWISNINYDIEYNGKIEKVFIPFDNKKHEGYKYFCLSKSECSEPFKNGVLCLAAEFWDYTPILLKNLSEIFSNMIEFEAIEIKEEEEEEIEEEDEA